MLPKQDKTPTEKLSKQKPTQKSSPESEISPLGPKKIPKRPFFRSVVYDNVDRVQHIRVKLWKIHSFTPLEFDQDPQENDSDDDFVDEETKLTPKEIFQNTLKSSTIKKGLRHVKRIEYDPSSFSKHRFMKQTCSTWRLHSLLLTFEEKFKDYSILRPFLSSSLKNCYLRFNTEEERIDPKLVAAFRIVRKCKLIIDSDANEIYMRINTAQLFSHRSLNKFFPVKETDDSGWELVRNQIIINSPECFEEIWFRCPDAPTRGTKVNPDLSFLPNLQDLQFGWSKPRWDGQVDDLSFVKQYRKLQNLAIRLRNREAETLDFIADLSELKEFKFTSIQPNARGPIRSLPNLSKLERFGLNLTESSRFTTQHVRDFISKNKGLKELDLSLKIEDMRAVLEENENFTLPEIEKLKIDLDLVFKRYAEEAKKIAETLKRHDSIKELTLTVSKSYGDLNAILLKDGLAQMKSLEKLTLEFGTSGEPEESKYLSLKDVFTKLTGLVELDLDLSCDAIESKEFGTILDGLMELKNLKRFVFRAKLAELTPAAFDKLSRFLVSLRHMKGLEIDLTGISEEDGRKLRGQLLPKFPLSYDFFSFSPHVVADESFS